MKRNALFLLPLMLLLWRMPNMNELHSLVDYSQADPATDTVAFPGVVSSGYWSSTSLDSFPGAAWSVHFNYGLVAYYAKSNSLEVRAVRGGLAAVVPSNQAVLGGSLSGAKLLIFSIENLKTPIAGPFTATENMTQMDKAGLFSRQAIAAEDAAYVLVTVSGGTDLDADGNGVIDASPLGNQGTLCALLTASQYRTGEIHVSVISDLVWQYTKNLIGQVNREEITKRIE